MTTHNLGARVDEKFETVNLTVSRVGISAHPSPIHGTEPVNGPIQKHAAP
jgi:hypothetical protein